MFDNFEKDMDEILEMGKIAEVEIHRPKSKMKTFPKGLMKSFGGLKEFDVDILKLCDGKKSADDIAEELGIQQDDVILSFEKLKKLKLIS